MSFSSANSSTDDEEIVEQIGNDSILRQMLEQDVKSLDLLDSILQQVSVLTEQVQTIADNVTANEKKSTVLVKERRRRHAESGVDSLISASPARVTLATSSTIVETEPKSPARSSSPRLFDLLRRKTNSLNASPISNTSNSGKNLIVSPRRHYEFIEQKPLLLHRRIGDGGTASAYEASVGGLMLVAKIYHQHFSNDDKEKNRRLRNIDILCSLAEHANILTTFAMRFENNRLMALNMRAHCTLADLLDTSSAVGNSVESVERVIHHLASALAFLHEGCSNQKCKAIIHRDIKPDNVFCKHSGFIGEWYSVGQSNDFSDCTSGAICNNWQHYTFALGDFDEAHAVLNANNPGIDWVPADSEFLNSEAGNDDVSVLLTCRSDSNKSDSSKLSQKSALASSDTVIFSRTSMSSPRCAASNRDPIIFNGQKMIERLDLGVGTPEYMAPEIASTSSATYDSKVDIWSLGMVIYEMMTLQVPHAICETKMTRFQLHDLVSNGAKPTIPKNVLQNARWQKVLQIYARCTEVEPKKRASASEILKMMM